MTAPSAPKWRRLRIVAGCLLVLVCLGLSVLADGLMMLTAIGTAPAPFLWIFQGHLALVLVALAAVAWQGRDRSIWLFALAIAAIPFVAVVVLLLS